MTEVQFAKQFLTTLDSKTTKYQADHIFDPKTFQTRIPYTLPKLSHPPHPLPPKRSIASTTIPPPAPGSTPSTSSSGPTITLTLKSTRNPTFTLHLPSTPLTTPITTLKSQIQHLLGATVTGAEKIKILQTKKPLPASKTSLADVFTSTETTGELGVLVIGGAPDPSPQEQTIHLGPSSSSGGEEVAVPAGPGSENAAVEAVTGVNPQDQLLQKEEGEGNGTSTKLKRERRESSDAVRPGEVSGRDVLQTKEFWDDLQGFLEVRLRSLDEAARLRAAWEKSE